MKSLLLLAASIIFLLSAGSTLAIPCDSTPTDELCNPVERPGGFNSGKTPAATNIMELATKIMFIMAGFATLLPIIAVTYSGFSMIVSQGNQEAVTRARTSLTWAVAGFVVAILSYVIVLGVIDLMGADRLQNINPLTPSPTIENPLSQDEFLQFIYLLLDRFLKIVGAVAILFLIISGFRYITSGGNEEQAKQGRAGLTWSVAGIITILFSYVIIKAAAAIFGVS